MPENATYNITELKIKASGGDEKAFKGLFDVYHHQLFEFILNIIKSNEVAEELVMDVFLKLWLTRESLPEIENMDGFLFRIAYNKCVDFFRGAAKNKHMSSLLLDYMQIASQSHADTSLLVREYEAVLRAAINLLPPKRKEIFNLSREEGLTHAEIAAKLGISPNTVANSIVEARHFIKDYLAKNIDLALFVLLFSKVFNDD